MATLFRGDLVSDGDATGLPTAPSSSSSSSSLSSVVDPSSTGRLFSLNRLGPTTYFLALLYLLLACYASYQLRRIHRLMGRGFQTQKLFHGFVTILVWLRALAFGLLSLFLVLDSPLWYPATILLFTLPEYFILSTYLLLWFQWLEVYITSHDQFLIESKRRFRTKWLVTFFILSISIYMLLSILYILLVLRSDQVEDSVVLIILWTTAFGNLILPAGMLMAALYFVLMMSGFTFSSELTRKRVVKMNSVFGIWTAGRLARGVLLILSILFQWQQRLNSLYLCLSTVSILLLTEVLPLLSVLNWSNIGLLLFGEGAQPDDEFDYAEIDQSIGGSARTSEEPTRGQAEDLQANGAPTAEEAAEELLKEAALNANASGGYHHANGGSEPFAVGIHPVTPSSASP